ncbi:hypothetical protein M8R20_13915 [Pseudomonas sp. R2.Fl]|nr:hypothetical protein [Pseudomonas sp. R2.Fl]
MATDWNLIREMMGAAIDACERIEASGYGEEDRDATIDVRGQDVSIHDMLVGAWTYAENIRYRIIRTRHIEGKDLPYVPETARILAAVAHAGAELIGSGEGHAPAEAEIRQMIAWMNTHAVPGIERAVAARRGETKS